MNIKSEVVKFIDELKKTNFINNCAAMSFFAIIAFFSLTVLLVIAGTFVPSLSYKASMLIYNNAPKEIAIYINNLFSAISLPSGYISISIAVLSCIWSTSKVIKATIHAFDSIYYYDESKHKRKVLFSVLFTIVFEAILLALLALISISDILLIKIIEFGVSPFVIKTYNYVMLVFPLVLLFFFMASIYHFLTSISTSFRSIWIGSVFASVTAFLLSKTFSMYFSAFSSFPSLLGSFGLIFIFLIWAYYNCMLILFGCFINSYINNR